MSSLLKPSDFDSVPVTNQGTQYITNDHLKQPVVPPAGYSRESIWGKVHWKLKTIEPASNNYKAFSVRGQFPLKDGIKVSMNNNIASSSSYGQQAPLIQWLSGELEVVTFEVMLYARDANENINQKFEQFKKLKDRDTDLRRPPLCRFTYGDIYTKKCLVKGFGDVAFGPARDDGSSREITFTITLDSHEHYQIKEIDKNKPLHYSRHTLVSQEDRNWETLAAKQWGAQNAIYGDRLRKLNKSGAFAAETETMVTIPDGDIILNEDVQPELAAFDKSNPAATTNLINKILARKNKIAII